jgi:glycosyltransferase involved in cell wall biosynthesis
MRILMITIGYPPKQVGGTEVYVSGLIEALKEKGHQCVVAYVEDFDDHDGPALQVASRECEGTEVHAIQVNSAKHKLEFIVFDAELRAKLIAEFRKLVSDLRPDVIHVHPLQLGFDSYLIEDLNQAGEKVVMTFHSSTTTCARGDLIYMGAQVCDTLVLQDRCTKCLYHWKSVPAVLAAPLSKLPVSWFRSTFKALADWPSLKKLRSFVSIPLVIEERRKAWKRTTDNAKEIVAVCEWVRDTIIKNGWPPERVVFSRHGLRLGAETNGRLPSGPLRLGYLGRVSPEKGIGLLLQVLATMPPEIDYAFEFCSSSFKSTNRRPEEEELVQGIYRLQKQDSRVRVLDNVGDNELRAVLAKWDAMVVPSLWLESGPQVIYEAFAVKTPIIGSRLGGIAELVREGETGFLCARNSVNELTTLLRRFAKRPADLRRLRGNIPPVKTTGDVAEDMLKVYERVLATAARTVERRLA